MHSGLMSQEEARDLAEANLNNVVDELDFSALADGVSHYKGKVRDNFTVNTKRIMHTSDRVSAFDEVVGTVPFKGQVLDTIAKWHFGKTADLVENHIYGYAAPTITVALECEPFLVEMVVRGYLTGTSSTSIWTAYDKHGAREFCGNILPDGMRKDRILPYVMVTPSTKAAQGEHDESVPPEVAMLALPGNKHKRAETYLHLNNQALVLFGMGSALADAAGLILVDTKYEFGRAPGGRIVLMDEIHTPDSSRYWEKADYQERVLREGGKPTSLSKQFVRDAIIGMGYDPEKGGEVPKLDDEARIECAARYIDLCQRITGEPFAPDTRPVGDRVYQPLEDLGVLRR